MQGLWMKEDPMLQLPHFNENVLKRLRKRRTELKIQTKNNLQEFLKLEPEVIKGLDLFEGNAEKQLDLEECVRAMPRVECSVRAYSLGPNPDDPEGDLIENAKLFASDFIKIEFRVKYLNLEMDDREGYVHTRNYPYLKKHSWHFMLCDGQSGDKIFHLSQKLRFNERKTKAKKGEEEDWKEYDGSIYTTFSQRIGRAGEYHFQVHFLSDSYMGLDQSVPFSFKLHPDDPNDFKEYEYSKEDKNAVQGSSGIQALFAEDNEGFDSDEEEKGEDGRELNDTEKLKKRLEEAGLKDAFKPREGSGVVRPEFDSKGRTVNPYAKDEGNMRTEDGRVEGESDSDEIEQPDSCCN